MCALALNPWPPRELLKRKAVLQRVAGEGEKVGVVLEARGLERQLREKEAQLVEAESEN